MQADLADPEGEHMDGWVPVFKRIIASRQADVDFNAS